MARDMLTNLRVRIRFSTSRNTSRGVGMCSGIKIGVKFRGIMIQCLRIGWRIQYISWIRLLVFFGHWLLSLWRRHRTICGALLARSLTRSRSFVWTPSSWFFIVFATMRSSNTIVANGSGRVASNFTCTTDNGVKLVWTTATLRLTIDDTQWQHSISPSARAW